jgi:hypothetical protein
MYFFEYLPEFETEFEKNYIMTSRSIWARFMKANQSQSSRATVPLINARIG